MRDTVQSEEYFRERFNKDSEKLKRQLQDYHNDIEIGPHPEKFDIRSYKHFLYIDAFLKFNSGYSLGLDMQELLPEVHIMVRNLIDTRKMRDVGYAYMENILKSSAARNIPMRYMRWCCFQKRTKRRLLNG